MTEDDDRASKHFIDGRRPQRLGVRALDTANWKPAIRANLDVTFRLAALVAEHFRCRTMPSPRRSSRPERMTGYRLGKRRRDRRAVTRRRGLALQHVVEATLARIAARDPVLNAFTAVTAERAASARRRSTRRARPAAAGPLAGVPFAVKNLFDVTGLPTRAGSKINRDLPARRTIAADRAARSRRRGAGRRAQHGRIRLRFHRRERPRRPLAQSARHDAA